jgi:hypothetical protein
VSLFDLLTAETQNTRRKRWETNAASLPFARLCTTERLDATTGCHQYLDMNPLTCRQCGTELPPGTNFCRQCGSAISANLPPPPDERPTALLEDTDIVATQRLDPRPTSQNRPQVNPPAKACSPAAHKVRKIVLAAVVLFLVASGVVGIVSLRLRRHNSVAADSFIYPGARKNFDMLSDGGGRAIELETSDSLDTVADWYHKTLQAEKVVQLTPSAVVMKNKKITATVVAERDKTHVLLKIVP